MGGAHLSNERKLRRVPTHGHSNALVSYDASRRGTMSRPTLFRWPVSLKTLVCGKVCAVEISRLLYKNDLYFSLSLLFS